MKDIYKIIAKFSKNSFPDTPAEGHAKKLLEEAKDLLEDVNDIDEVADCLIATFGAASKAGHSLAAIKSAILKKVNTLEQSDWLPKGDGTYKRIKTDEKKVDLNDEFETFIVRRMNPPSDLNSLNGLITFCLIPPDDSGLNKIKCFVDENETGWGGFDLELVGTDYNVLQWNPSAKYLRYAEGFRIPSSKVLELYPNWNVATFYTALKVLMP